MDELKPCLFCHNMDRVSGEYARCDMQIVKLIPFPPINLTTGEIAKHADPPYYALFIFDAEDDEKDGGEVESFPIEYCPMCGRRL